LTQAAPVQSADNPDAGFKVPIIENIHQKVLEAVTAPNHTLNMTDWHSCETTHCRAGWVVTIAGKEGKELELKTSTAFAALQIYDKSSEIKVPPTRFYDDAKKAMADIVKCAEEEKSNTKL
jgi:hypothetical protein